MDSPLYIMEEEDMETNTIKASAKRYDEQFKKDTLDYWIKNKLLAKEVSEAFELSETTLCKWRRKYEFNNVDPNRSIEAELYRLRKENSELRQERDILKSQQPFSSNHRNEVSIY